MKIPKALRKHDGRIVAFDLARFSRSIAAAARSSGDPPGGEAAGAFGREIAGAAAEFLVREYSDTPSTADVRELTVRLLRETGRGRAAEAYAGYARASASLLWRMRLNDGAPWDRRRLCESLRRAGVARDPAGEVARKVEHRLAQLDLERISASLVHALAELELAARGLDPRRYTAQRLAVSMARQVPRYDPDAAATCPLPPHGPALEAFWRQAVHSEEVAAAARNNILGLAPYPNTPGASLGRTAAGGLLDPLQAGAAGRIAACSRMDGAEAFWVRADDAERMGALARLLARAAAEGQNERGERGPARARELRLVLRAPARPDAAKAPRAAASPITLNAGGLLVREAIRDQQRITMRLAHLVALAAQAHREREEYWGYSPVRGRELPLVAAGLWNAAAWLAREPYDRAKPTLPLRLLAGTLASVLHGAAVTLRQETGLNLRLLADAPRTAAAALWRRDCEFFAQDGVHLDPNGAYTLGLELKIGGTLEDLGERVDFLRSIAPLFDEPPPLHCEAPLGRETDPAAWREFLAVLRRSGVPRARLARGGSPRGMRLLGRLIREHLEGYPLFEQRSG